jgi:hypothetical protein
MRVSASLIREGRFVGTASRLLETTRTNYCLLKEAVLDAVLILR